MIDAPNLPAPAVSGMKKSVMMVFAGMFVGFLISLLAVVLLTSSDEQGRSGRAPRRRRAGAATIPCRWIVTP